MFMLCIFSLYVEWNVFDPAVRLGAMLGFAQMDEESLTLLLSHVHDFLRYSNASLNEFTQTRPTV